MSRLLALLLLQALSLAIAHATPPNVVIVFIDDMGYADIGPFGCTRYPTPHLDRMAAEGRCFTDFHSGSAVCSESRAALLTGCYPPRVNIQGALFPDAQNGLSPDETTLAEVCRAKGYATACIGKWHLGDLPQFLPTRQGFDEYLGLPYSNDMWPYLRGEQTLDAGVRHHNGKPMPPLPLYDGEEVVDDNVTPEDQQSLTTRYTERAVDFIDRHAGRQPFFLYMPHTMVHVPLYVSERFAGQSGAGLYGDVVMEIDWSVGQIFAALERGGVADNTLVVFTSDNGPWLVFGDHGGQAQPLREGKNTMWEGGYRVPCLMRWPARIPAGTACDELASALDLLPTIASLIGTPLPEHQIDGKDINGLLTGGTNESPHEVLYGYHQGALKVVRDRRWKLVLRHRYDSIAGGKLGRGGRPGQTDNVPVGLELYDLKHDIGETKNVAGDHPEVVARLQQHAAAAREELGDKLTGAVGTAVRR
ncbi:sulfatase family protein [Botrimarina hoheduenensis]|uniref:Arylsulfatase n=1 Tax=Botrimarina hoheduenensis TaxID=2528000 RepID=A0A5C5W6U3_9BACT|nr:sulfatase [Botrimarina hoheduenensis]TWT46638.1 Arylsulfatase [Botrimarina hoheduenensis]